MGAINTSGGAKIQSIQIEQKAGVDTSVKRIKIEKDGRTYTIRYNTSLSPEELKTDRTFHARIDSMVAQHSAISNSYAGSKGGKKISLLNKPDEGTRVIVKYTKDVTKSDGRTIKAGDTKEYTLSERKVEIDNRFTSGGLDPAVDKGKNYIKKLEVINSLLGVVINPAKPADTLALHALPGPNAQQKAELINFSNAGYFNVRPDLFKDHDYMANTFPNLNTFALYYSNDGNIVAARYDKDTNQFYPLILELGTDTESISDQVTAQLNYILREKAASQPKAVNTPITPAQIATEMGKISPSEGKSDNYVHARAALLRPSEDLHPKEFNDFINCFKFGDDNSQGPLEIRYRFYQSTNDPENIGIMVRINNVMCRHYFKPQPGLPLEAQVRAEVDKITNQVAERIYPKAETLVNIPTPQRFNNEQQAKASLDSSKATAFPQQDFNNRNDFISEFRDFGAKIQNRNFWADNTGVHVLYELDNGKRFISHCPPNSSLTPEQQAEQDFKNMTSPPAPPVGNQTQPIGARPLPQLNAGGQPMIQAGSTLSTPLVIPTTEHEAKLMLVKGDSSAIPKLKKMSDDEFKMNGPNGFNLIQNLQVGGYWNDNNGLHVLYDLGNDNYYESTTPPNEQTNSLEHDLQANYNKLLQPSQTPPAPPVGNNQTPPNDALPLPPLNAGVNAGFIPPGPPPFKQAGTNLSSVNAPNLTAGGQLMNNAGTVPPAAAPSNQSGTTAVNAPASSANQAQTTATLPPVKFVNNAEEAKTAITNPFPTEIADNEFKTALTNPNVKITSRTYWPEPPLGMKVQYGLSDGRYHISNIQTTSTSTLTESQAKAYAEMNFRQFQPASAPAGLNPDQVGAMPLPPNLGNLGEAAGSQVQFAAGTQTSGPSAPGAAPGIKRAELNPQARTTTGTTTHLGAPGVRSGDPTFLQAFAPNAGRTTRMDPRTMREAPAAKAASNQTMRGATNAGVASTTGDTTAATGGPAPTAQTAVKQPERSVDPYVKEIEDLNKTFGAYTSGAYTTTNAKQDLEKPEIPVGAYTYARSRSDPNSINLCVKAEDGKVITNRIMYNLSGLRIDGGNTFETLKELAESMGLKPENELKEIKKRQPSSDTTKRKPVELNPQAAPATGGSVSTAAKQPLLTVDDYAKELEDLKTKIGANYTTANAKQDLEKPEIPIGAYTFARSRRDPNSINLCVKTEDGFIANKIRYNASGLHIGGDAVETLRDLVIGMGLLPNTLEEIKNRQPASDSSQRTEKKQPEAEPASSGNASKPADRAKGDTTTAKADAGTPTGKAAAKEAGAGSPQSVVKEKPTASAQTADSTVTKGEEKKQPEAVTPQAQPAKASFSYEDIRTKLDPEGEVENAIKGKAPGTVLLARAEVGSPDKNIHIYAKDARGNVDSAVITQQGSRVQCNLIEGNKTFDSVVSLLKALKEQYSTSPKTSPTTSPVGSPTPGRTNDISDEIKKDQRFTTSLDDAKGKLGLDVNTHVMATTNSDFFIRDAKLKSLDPKNCAIMFDGFETIILAKIDNECYSVAVDSPRGQKADELIQNGINQIKEAATKTNEKIKAEREGFAAKLGTNYTKNKEDALKKLGVDTSEVKDQKEVKDQNVTVDYMQKLIQSGEPTHDGKSQIRVTKNDFAIWPSEDDPTIMNVAYRAGQYYAIGTISLSSTNPDTNLKNILDVTNEMQEMKAKPLTDELLKGIFGEHFIQESELSDQIRIKYNKNHQRKPDAFIMVLGKDGRNSMGIADFKSVVKGPIAEDSFLIFKDQKEPTKLKLALFSDENYITLDFTLKRGENPEAKVKARIAEFNAPSGGAAPSPASPNTNSTAQ